MWALHVLVIDVLVIVGNADGSWRLRLRVAVTASLTVLTTWPMAATNLVQIQVVAALPSRTL